MSEFAVFDNVTVYIVDDNADVGESMAMVLASTGYATKVFYSGAEFLKRYRPDKPGCILLDYHMPRMGGLEVQEALYQAGCDPVIIFVTGMADVAGAVSAMRSGALDVLLKPPDPELLLQRVQEAIEEDQSRRQRQASVVSVQRCARHLTKRQREVAELLAAGESCKQIARKLEISYKTAENHRTAILDKMGVDNLAQLTHQLELLH